MNDLLVDLRAKTPFMRLRFDGWYAATAKNGTHRIMPAADFDALLSRLEAAEARAERAVGMLEECGQAFALQEEPDGLCDRIAALLKEVSHGQQG